MLEHFMNKKSPAITIQGVLLASSVLYLEHGGSSNLQVVFTVVLLLSLFVLQAINHRFFYYFPHNQFTGKETKHIDTYILYLMTFLSFLSFIWGISQSSLIAAVATILILAPGYLWRKLAYEKVRDRIAIKLGSEDIVDDVSCPKCGSKAKLTKKVYKWNLGNEKIECDGCGYNHDKPVPLNIG